MPGYVHDFTDEIQAGDFAALHGLGGKLVGVHPAGGDFGFVVAVGVFWGDDPVVRLAFQFSERVVGPGRRRVQIEPAVG